jgi:hypothetical protein
MVWFFERESEVLVCEIRRDEASTTYEFEIAGPNGPTKTLRFSSATELIDAYLEDQRQLRSAGWRPRAADIAVLD